MGSQIEKSLETDHTALLERGMRENCCLSIYLGINKVINREARGWQEQAAGALALPPSTVDALKVNVLRRKTRIFSGSVMKRCRFCLLQGK